MSTSKQPPPAERTRLQHLHGDHSVSMTNPRQLPIDLLWLELRFEAQWHSSAHSMKTASAVELMDPDTHKQPHVTTR